MKRLKGVIAGVVVVGKVKVEAGMEMNKRIRPGSERMGRMWEKER